MRHFAAVFTSPNTVTLLTSMRPAVWKKVAFGFYLFILVGLPFAVALITGTEESGKQAVIPVIGIMAMLIFWPGLSLLWNVKGEELIEVSTSAVRIRQNWGLFQTAPKTFPFESLQVTGKTVRTIEATAYQTLDFWSRDEHGFDQHLTATAIPVPASEIQAFLNELENLFGPMENGNGEFPPVLPN